jgi:hypothetical protein
VDQRLVLGVVAAVLLGFVTWLVISGNDSRTSTAADVAPSPAGGPSVGAASSAGPSSGPSSSLAPPASISASSTPGARTGPNSAKGPVSTSRGSFPSAGNTGIPAGARLKPTTSTTIRVMKAGTVLDGIDIRADISIEADNVTIKNSRVITAGEWGIIQRQNAKNLVVQDSEIRGNGKDRLQHAVFNLGGYLTIRRTEMSAVSDAVSTPVGLIEDNYLHDPVYFDGDHTDMIQSNSGPPAGQSLIIRHNTVINTLDQTSAVALFQDFGVQHDALIEDNLLAGGGYALYAGSGTKGTSYNIKIINNVFSREVHKNSGQFGPVAYWDQKGSGNVWQGNVWADTKQPITP